MPFLDHDRNVATPHKPSVNPTRTAPADRRGSSARERALNDRVVQICALNEYRREIAGRIERDRARHAEGKIDAAKLAEYIAEDEPYLAAIDRVLKRLNSPRRPRRNGPSARRFSP